MFDGKVISCRLKLCKPEAGIYEHVLRTYALEAKDTLFIDDVEKNLDAAGSSASAPSGSKTRRSASASCARSASMPNRA